MSPPDYFTAMQRARQLQSEEFWRIMGLAARALRRFAASLAGSIRARRLRRRAIAELLTMDQRGLRDLGLSRAYVPFVVDHGREDLPPAANTNLGPTKTTSAA